MATVSKRVLKSRMAAYFRKVEETGEELVVTDRRKPVLRVVPFRARTTFKDAFGDWQGKAVFRSPATEPETSEWGDRAW